jgi:hypothetical protein
MSIDSLKVSMDIDGGRVDFTKCEIGWLPPFEKTARAKMKTRKDLEREIVLLRSALVMIEHGQGPADVIARATLLKLLDDGGNRKWQTLVQVRENNNSVPGAVTITARRRWQR